MELFGKGEAAGILLMAAVHHVAERLHILFRVVIEPYPSPSLAIDHGDLLAPAQIVDRGRALGLSHPIGDAAAIAAAVKAEYQPGSLRRAAVDEGVDAERPVGAHEAGRAPVQKTESRP